MQPILSAATVAASVARAENPLAVRRTAARRRLDRSCAISRRSLRISRHPPPPGHHGPRLRGRTPAPQPGTFANPDTRSPARFLVWLLGQQRLVLFVSSLTAVLEWLPGAVGPYVVGRIVDEGITAARPRPGRRARR